MFSAFRGHEVEPIIRIYNASNSLEEIKEQTIQISPNPAKDIIQVSAPSQEIGLNWNLLTLEGKQVMSGIAIEENFQINIQRLPDGIYLFSIRGDNYYSTIKLIILQNN